MTTIISPEIIGQRDDASNSVRMNSRFLDLVSNASLCDCQGQTLKNYFQDFYLATQFSIQSNIEKFRTGVALNLRPTAHMMRFLESKPYSDTMQYRVEVPEGLKVTYLEYLDVLIPAQQRANQILDVVIRPLKKYVGKLITDEVFRNSINHSIKEFTNLEASYKKTSDGFTKCFKVNDFTPTAALGEMVKRTSDWKTVFSRTEELKKAYDAYDQKTITKELNELYEVVDELVRQVKIDGFDNIDKSTTKLLSGGMYHVAREIELSAVTTFRSQTFMKTINTTIEMMDALGDRMAK